MIDISAPRIGPELAARRVAFTLNIGAGAVAIWQGIFPNVLTGAACIAALRWRWKIGQAAKVGSTSLKDGLYDWETEAVLG